jgi:hypothetical protein
MALVPTRENAVPRTALARWLLGGGRLDQLERENRTFPWFQVVWLTGVDYFSSLAYQPGIALIAAGILAPTATLILVAVTVLGALPVYAQVAQRSYVGQGSIAMLENLLQGWSSKLVVLVLIGFAATDFVITMTLSAADAARHAAENPYLQPYLAHAHMALTLGLLALLAVIFLVGFREAIQLAVFVAIPYLLLNLIVFVAGLVHILRHPGLIAHWQLSLTTSTDWTGVFVASALIFPKLALGLSGFETGVSVMPLISGKRAGDAETTPPSDEALEEGPSPAPRGRIRNTRKLLALAAGLMGVLLILSSFTSTLLIPSSAYHVGGPASGRAPAYLAHQLLGDVFGSIYDLSTIAILWFAGASAMAGLINLVPRYLPRFGMAPRWVSYRRPMVLALFSIDVVVTLIFGASVEKQGGAYATGVLALILSAAVAVTLAKWREFRAVPRGRRWRLPATGYFLIVSCVFAYTFIANVFERPDGVIISTVFIFLVLGLSGISRYVRSRELRVADIVFSDPGSAKLWSEVTGRKVNLVPVQGLGAIWRTEKATDIRTHYNVGGPLAFLHVHLLDNRSEFLAHLRVRIRRDAENYVIDVSGAVAVANTIAYVSELIDPKTIFLVLSRRNLMKQALDYLFWGEGEIGLMVYTILVHYWEWTKQLASHPRLYLMTR